MSGFYTFYLACCAYSRGVYTDAAIYGSYRIIYFNHPGVYFVKEMYMSLNAYSPTLPIDAIIFDCDGTLSHIEGIDELAKENGVGEQGVKLTEEAMGRSGMSPELYEHRLNLVLPTAAQVDTLGQLYFQHK